MGAGQRLELVVRASKYAEHPGGRAMVVYHMERYRCCRMMPYSAFSTARVLRSYRRMICREMLRHERERRKRTLRLPPSRDEDFPFGR